MTLDRGSRPMRIWAVSPTPFGVGNRFKVSQSYKIELSHPIVRASSTENLWRCFGGIA